MMQPNIVKIGSVVLSKMFKHDGRGSPTQSNRSLEPLRVPKYAKKEDDW